MNCLFCKIIKREISAEILCENSDILAFRDINPQAPTHILVIPKKHIATVNDVEEKDQSLMGQMILTARNIAAQEGIADKGYRLVLNTNDEGGQEIHHIHLHILGGRKMSWPPG